MLIWVSCKFRYKPSFQEFLHLIFLIEFTYRNEALCHRSINGIRLHEGIQILAALNPYRLKPESFEVVGAGLSLDIQETSMASVSVSGGGSDRLQDFQMNRLVYKVHKIPLTMQDFIFDFGALEESTELLYIQSMVKKHMGKGPAQVRDDRELSIIASLISGSQVIIFLRLFNLRS